MKYQFWYVSYNASAIASKSKLLGVATHNLRKYKSDDYSKDNIIVLQGTDDLFQDVKNVYYQEFDDVVKEYYSKAIIQWEIKVHNRTEVVEQMMLILRR